MILCEKLVECGLAIPNMLQKLSINLNDTGIFSTALATHESKISRNFISDCRETGSYETAKRLVISWIELGPRFQPWNIRESPQQFRENAARHHQLPKNPFTAETHPAAYVATSASSVLDLQLI